MDTRCRTSFCSVSTVVWTVKVPSGFYTRLVESSVTTLIQGSTQEFRRGVPTSTTEVPRTPTETTKGTWVSMTGVGPFTHTTRFPVSSSHTLPHKTPTTGSLHKTMVSKRTTLWSTIYKRSSLNETSMP